MYMRVIARTRSSDRAIHVVLVPYAQCSMLFLVCPLGVRYLLRISSLDINVRLRESRSWSHTSYSMT